MDDIITNAQHLNELRSEVSMDIIDNHTFSLKKLKRIVTNKEVELPKSELAVICFKSKKKEIGHSVSDVEKTV